MSHEGIKELLAAYALDALDADERREAEQHLLSCAECRAELDDLRAPVAALAYAVAPIAPAPDTRARLLSALKHEATPTRPVAAADARAITSNGGNEHNIDNEADTSAASTQAASNASNVVPFHTAAERNAARRKSSSWLRFGTLAACVALALLAIALGTLWQKARHTNLELARVAEELRTAQSELARLRADRDLLAAAEARTATLAAAPTANGSNTSGGQRARARLTYDEATGRALLVAADLPPVPTGKAYQLWFIAEGKPLPGGVFRPDATGHAELRDEIPPAGRHAALFAVTLEPLSGSDAPTGGIIIKGASA